MRATWVILLVAGCGSSPKASTPDLSSPGDLLPTLSQPTCLPSGYTVVPFVTDTPVRSFTQADQVLVSGKDYVAVLETDAGCFALDLYETQAPITTNSFVFLTLHHFFDGIAFHRVIDGFVAQAGDPNTVGDDRSNWGVGGPGYSFGLEVTPALNYDDAGVVGMARSSDPNSNGSQFFITLAAASKLDQQYTIFAKLLNGQTNLPNIARGEPPATPTRITAASIAAK